MSDDQVEPDEPKYVPVPLPISSQIPSTPQAAVITGGPGTGKTQRLVDRARALADEPSARIAVFCATPDAAHVFSQRMSEGIEGIVVTTPRSFSLDLLASPEAQRFTGRDARLLAPFEEYSLMEDLATSGMDPKRLREMVRFLRRGMAELADDDENWLINDEEVGLFDELKNNLAFNRGLLEPEVMGTAVRYLRTLIERDSAPLFDYVLVDDYQLLSRASQYLANLLAQQSIWVTNDPAQTAPVFDSFPYSQGVEEFLNVNAAAETIDLTSSFSSDVVIKALEGLQSDADVDELPGAADVPSARIFEIKAENPAFEMKGIADFVEEELHGLQPEDIYVVSPCRTWTGNIAKVLEQRGIEADIAFDPTGIRYRFGDSPGNDICRIITALNLIANPFDGVAWRNWCGFDDYLANSDGIRILREAGQSMHLAFDGMLDRMVTDPIPCDSDVGRACMERIAKAYSSGISLIKRTHDLEGDELMTALTAEVLGDGKPMPTVVERLLTPSADSEDHGEDAASLHRRLRARLDSPAFDERAAVKIGPIDGLVGLRPRCLLLAGFVNGFTPPRAYFDQTVISLDEKSAMLIEQSRALRAAIGSCDGDIAFSVFAETGLVQAEKLNLKIERIGTSIPDRIRYARVSPSIFLEVIDASHVRIVRTAD